MIQHVGIEIAPADVDRAVELFTLIGFEPVEVPPRLGSGYTWVEREGTQVHLMHDEGPVAPPRGHLAVVVPELEATLERLRERGFEPKPEPEYWGSPRVKVLAPGGHVIELMQAPPQAGRFLRP